MNKIKLTPTEHRILMDKSPSMCKRIKAARNFPFSLEDGTEIKDFLKACMEEVIDQAEDDGRDLNTIETETFDALSNVFDQVREDTVVTPGVRLVLGDGHGFQKQKPNGWYDAEGREVRVLAPDEKAFNGHKSEELQGLTAGSLIRGAFDKSGRDPRVQNALSVGTGSAGGFTVPTHLTQELIDKLRNKSRVIQAGARTVLLETDTTSIARLATDPTPAWRAENAAVTESDPTFENVQFVAKSLAVQVKISNELLQDSVNIEQAINNALSQALALEIDRVALVGSGSGSQPQGVYGASNVLTIDQGTNGSAITDYTDLLDALEDLDENNVGDDRGVIMAPREYRTYNGFVDANNNPLTQPRVVADLPFYRTNQVPIDQTKGTSTNASSIFVGDWSHLMIGIRQALEITVNPFLYQGNLQTGFFAVMRADIQLSHPEAFCVIDGVTP